MVSFVLFFAIFMSFDSVTLKERKVNLGFKTEIEFNKESDIELIEKIQRYLDQIKKILKDSIAKRKELISEKRYTFTDFLNECMNVIKLLKDKEINNILDLLTGEFRKLNSNYNIIDTNKHANLRKILQNNDITLKNIRSKLSTFLLTLETREKGDFILELINSFYKKDSESKLKKFVNNLYLYKKGKLTDLNQIVQKGINNILVKHYLNLDENEKKEINMFLTNILKNIDADESESNIGTAGFYHESSISKQKPITKPRYPENFKKFRHGYDSDYEHIERRNLVINNNFSIQQTPHDKTKNSKLRINNSERPIKYYVTRITRNDDSDKSEPDKENFVDEEIFAESGLSTSSITIRKVKEIRKKTNDTNIRLNWTTKKFKKSNTLLMNSETDFINLNKIRPKLKTNKTTKVNTKENDFIDSTNKEKESKNTKDDSTAKTFQTNLTKLDNNVTKSTETRPLNRFTSTATLETLNFNFNEFIKKSHYQDGDRTKNKKVEEKMKADLSKLFFDVSNITNIATERPDSFQELEKAFDFD